MAVVFSTANAITLFPHFVDLAGDFNQGTAEKFIELNIPIGYWTNSSHFFKNIKSADSFLEDTLPFSNYEIKKETETLDDGTEIIKYTSSLLSDGINEEKLSKLILIQTPGEPLFIGLYEDPT